MRIIKLPGRDYTELIVSNAEPYKQQRSYDELSQLNEKLTDSGWTHLSISMSSTRRLDIYVNNYRVMSIGVEHDEWTVESDILINNNPTAAMDTLRITDGVCRYAAHN